MDEIDSYHCSSSPKVILDQLWLIGFIGFIIGLVFAVLLFTCYYLYKRHKVSKKLIYHAANKENVDIELPEKGRSSMSSDREEGREAEESEEDSFTFKVASPPPPSSSPSWNNPLHDEVVSVEL